MIVCQCHNVSHHTIDAAIAEGADTVAALGRRCGAGTGCGGCIGHLKARILAARPRLETTPPGADAEHDARRANG